jgi:hypothetical protein
MLRFGKVALAPQLVSGAKAKGQRRGGFDDQKTTRRSFGNFAALQSRHIDCVVSSA